MLAGWPDQAVSRQNRRMAVRSRTWSGVRFRPLWSALAGLLLVGAARAADDFDAATIYLADGTHRKALVRSLAAGELVLARDGAQRLSTADVVRVEFLHHAVTTSRGSLIRLANGDQIVAGLSSMNGESVVALWKSYPDLSPVQIPAASVAGILVNVPDGVAEQTRAYRQVFGRREKSDTVLLVNGDHLAGDLASFDQAALKLTQAGKTLQIELPRVRGIALSSELTSLPQTHTPRVMVTLGDGSQLTGWNTSYESGGTLRLSSVEASTLELPLAAVTTLRFLDGRATWLSDLTPSASRLAPYFGPASTASAALRDQNAAGGPLLVRGRPCGKGLGTRSRSRLLYELGGQYRLFQATAAIDDFAAGKGSVRFAIDADGKRLWTSDLVTGSARPLNVGPLDVTGKQQIALVVEYGELADVDDWADWCDAVIIR